jgi:hypothetical protein
MSRAERPGFFSVKSSIPSPLRTCSAVIGTIQELKHADGRMSRVYVLDKEYSREGNAVLVWPGEAPLRIEPLLIRGG